MKALVTGANGFLGAHLTRRLVAEGWKVHGMARSDAGAAVVEGLGARPVRGDVEDARSLPPMEGLDAVFHAAARVDLGRPSRAAMLRTNVEGTRNVLEAARRARVPRVVHYSSVAALGRKHAVADERVWHDGDYQGVYEESKHKAEQVALELGQGATDIIHILPAVVLGPGDPKSGAFFLRYLRRGFPVRPAPEGGTSFVHVDAVTQGALLALEKGRRNERYILSQVTWSLSELFEQLEQITGIPPPRKVPLWMVLCAAGLEEARAALARSVPRVTRDAVRLATTRRAFTSQKARAELGWDPPDFLESFRATVAYWQGEVGRAG